MNSELHENEKWILWNPLNMENCQAFSVEIKQEEIGTVFTVECENQFVNLIFNGFIPIYIYSDEGIRMATYLPVQEKNNDRYYFRKWFLYKIENSDFFKWAMAECYNLYENYKLQHFCIVTAYDVVDILSSTEPEIIVTPKEI
ncbi:MAG: hypothetical protein K2H19_08265 [Ruminococcus sp.]|nr:hypothetical protein [Ruminococcus sp.]